MRNRESANALIGSHQLARQDYAVVDNGPRGLFRALVLEVEPSA